MLRFPYGYSINNYSKYKEAVKEHKLNTEIC